MLRVLIAVAVGLASASVATAATPKPDAHDRALAQRLAAKVVAIQKSDISVEGQR